MKSSILLIIAIFSLLFMIPTNNTSGLAMYPANNVNFHTSDQDCLIPCNDIIELLPRDAIPSIDQPTYRTVKEEDEDGYLKDTSKILGLIVDGVHFAYPYKILNYHEIVNDNIGGNDLAITYCPLTGSGISFNRSPVNNSEFGVSGRLYENNLIMYDRNTESYWSQMMATSIKGEEIGNALQTILTVETRWRAWKSLYPETLVLSRNTQIYNPTSYETNPYLGYDLRNSIRFKTSYDLDVEPYNLYSLKTNTMIVQINNETMLFPFTELSSYSVINEVISGTPVIIVTDPFNDLSLAFSPKLNDGKLLSEFTQAAFEGLDPEDTFNLPVYRDSSDTIWNFKGIAIKGKHKGEQLTQLYSYNAYWFAAIIFHPHSKIFPQDATSKLVENSINLFNNRPGEKNNNPKELGISSTINVSFTLIIAIYIIRRKK